MKHTEQSKGESIQNNLLQIVSEKIKQIDYDFSRFSVQDFAQWVSVQRGLNIHLEPSDELSSPTGFWFLSDNGAHVIYSSALNQMLGTITILHELMHIYLGHETKYISSTHPLMEYLQFHQGVATRDSSRQSQEDQEAEFAAFLVYQRLVSGTGANPVSDMFNETDSI